MFCKFMHLETSSQEACAAMNCSMTGLTVVCTYSGVVCFYKQPSNKMHVCTLYSLLVNNLLYMEHAHELIWALTSWIVNYPQEIH